jgi:hypothetical protein
MKSWVLPTGLAVLGLALNIIVASRMAETFDEGWHIQYGAAILQGAPDRSSRFFDSKMPITALNAIPRGVAKLLGTRGIAPRFSNALRDIRAARIATIIATFGLSLLVYAYAASLFGTAAGIGAEALFVVSPTVMAHGTLATTDLYVACATVLFLFLLRRFLRSPRPGNAFLASAALGLAQLTKFVAVYLYIAVALVLIPVAVYARYGRNPVYRVPGRRIALFAALCVVCSLAIVNAGFLFDRTFTSLAEYRFRSATFQHLQHVPILRGLPLPLPYPYVQGFDWMSYHNATGSSFGNIVLLGQVRGERLARSDGFPSYYLAAYALKVPLGMQVLLLLGGVRILRRRRLSEFLGAEWPLLATAAVVLSMLSFFSHAQIGIRHILPVLVCLIVVSGAAFADWWQLTRPRQLLIGACVLYAVISVASYFPQMIPYFNEIVTDRKMAYRYLADSNLDWGQDRQIVARYLQDHRDVVLDPPAPTTGWVLVDANLAAGVIPATADYWIRQRALEPSGHVAYAHLLFWVPPESGR